MRFCNRRAVAVVTAALLAIVSPAAAVTVVLQPSSQDAFVTKDKPNRIAGAGPNNTRIRVQASPPNTQVRRGLVQFDLSSIPAGAIVSSAIVELYAGNNAGATLIHGLHRIGASWLQSAVKWNNQPTFAVSPTATASVGSGSGFKSFDVTADVQSFVIACTTDHGWLVKDQAETATSKDVNYIAKEENHIPDLPNRPKLTVTYTPPPCMVDADCDDDSACTVNETCVAGDCVVETLDCDDGDPCSDDICDCTIGCINAPICNDGFTCTIDTCDPETLECTNTPVDANCTTDCSMGTCVADPDSTVIDPVTGCVVTSTSPDGTACTPDAVACTDDHCVAGLCAHPPKSEGATCDDGNACTLTDVCGGGSCGGTPVVCTPASQCHDAGTCDTMTGLCSNPPKSAGAGCNDADACTQTDACDGAGGCVGSNPVVCSASDQCHDVGTCDSGSGICSDPPKANGAGCNDLDACTQTDQCNGAGTCVGANPVVCTPLDQCHVAGACDPETGVCSNPAAPDGTTCSDGNECTLSDHCIGGACVLGTSITCGDGNLQAGCGEECDDGGAEGGDCDAQCHFICGPVPQTGCHVPAVPGKAKLVLKDLAPDTRDRLTWKWTKGDATLKSEFGSPLTTTSFVLCIYDQSTAPQPILRAAMPAAGTCGTKPCWKEKAKGFKYKDTVLDPDGVLLLLTKAGEIGKAKIILKGKGANVPLPAMPLTPTVTVQLKNDTTCWQAEYGATVIKNDATQFKAKAN